MPRPLHIIEPPDFRRAGGDPDHARTQFAAQAGEDIIVDIGILTADERHRPDLTDQLKIVFHTPFLSLEGKRWAAAQTRLGLCPKPHKGTEFP